MTSRITLFVVCSASALQRLNHGQTGIDHRRQLSGENDQVSQRDFAAAGFSFLPIFPEWKRPEDCGLNSAAIAACSEQRQCCCDFPSGSRFPRQI